MICRGIQTKRTIIHPKDLPPLTIKEALEVYYSLKRSDKSLSMDQRWKYLNDRFIFQNYGSSSNFLLACSAMLKTVNYFEEKVKSVKRSPALMKKWNDKLNAYLAMPCHDNLNVSNVVNKFRAFEFAPPPPSTEVGGVCMACPNAGCPGCSTSRVMVKQEVKVPVQQPKPKPPPPTARAPPNKVSNHLHGRGGGTPLPKLPGRITVTKISEPVRNGLPLSSSTSVSQKSSRPPPSNAFGPSSSSSPSSVGGGGTPNQRIYYQATKLWKSKEDMKKEYWRVGKLLGFRRPASLSEVLSFYGQHGYPPGATPSGTAGPPKAKPAVEGPPPPAVAAPPVPVAGGESAEPPAGQKLFVCPNCPKRSFKSEGDLNRHKSAKCEREKMLAAKAKKKTMQQQQQQQRRGQQHQASSSSAPPNSGPNFPPTSPAYYHQGPPSRHSSQDSDGGFAPTISSVSTVAASNAFAPAPAPADYGYQDQGNYHGDYHHQNHHQQQHQPLYLQDYKHSQQQQQHHQPYSSHHQQQQHGGTPVPPLPQAAAAPPPPATQQPPAPDGGNAMPWMLSPTEDTECILPD